MTIRYTKGNLLEAEAEALVNTVNTVGVMGKGIALMFKESFPANFKAYAAACKAKEIRTGRMFVYETGNWVGPRFVINFPTKAHWRSPSRMEWIEEGLSDLVEIIKQRDIRSIALPPLGAGNGGLEWSVVRELIDRRLSALEDVDVLVFEPTSHYQNVSKRSGVQKLTPARASIAELIRRYAVLGYECSLIEVQKLGYFLERFLTPEDAGALNFQFEPNRYGPYSDRLNHMLNDLDGSYLTSDKRLADAGPYETIRFVDNQKEKVTTYLKSTDTKAFANALEKAAALIEGYESPLGMELLATVDWLTSNGAEATVEGIQSSLKLWPAGQQAALRKAQLFDDRLISIALEDLAARGPTGRQIAEAATS